MPRFKTILLFAVLPALLCACGEAVPSPSDDPAVEDGALVVIEGTELELSEIIFLLGNAMDEHALFHDMEPGRIDWDGQIGGVPVREHMLRRVLDMAVAAHVTGIKAAELGFMLSEEEEDAIDWGIAMDIGSMGGREAFLESVGSEDVYRFYTYVIPALHERMLESLFGVDGVYQPDDTALWFYFRENYTFAAYIYLFGTDAFGEPMDDEEWAVQKSVADALQRQAAALDDKEDFFAMIREHDQSYFMLVYPEGMAIPRGLNGDLFDDALLSLPVGGVSDVVVTEDGFYIILRLPENVAWFEEHKAEIWYFCVQELFYIKVEEWSREMEVIVNDRFWALDPADLIAVG
jgi:hypothetical protein